MKSSLVKALGLAVLISGLAAPFVASSQTAKETVAERIKPVGDLCMAGNECAAAVVASAGGGEPRSGEQVYSTKCFTCHATGAAGAPKFGDAAAWKPRIDAHGIDGLYDHALNGFNGMPAKGLCMDCSEEEIHAAVDHIVSSVQ